MRRDLIVILAMALIAICVGCSSNTKSPVIPGEITANIESSSAGATQLWGIWNVNLDPATATAEIVPLRGADFTCNVTQFLQPPIAHKNLMGIMIDPSTDWINGHAIVDVSFTHPFPGLDMYTGFDVRGVCMGNGSTPGISDPNIIYAGGEDLRVLNADGLTRWFNSAEFTSYKTLFGYMRGKLGSATDNWTAILNAYKYFCDGLGPQDDVGAFFADPDCTNPRGLYSAGNLLTRRYDIQFPVVGGVAQYAFQYAVIASWEPPNVSPPQNVPDDFPISANCQEAFCVSTTDESDMYYVDPSTTGGSLRLLVQVFDHQGAVNPSGVSAEIAAIRIETPGGLIPGDVATFDTAALSSALVVQDSNSATYELEVADVSPFAAGPASVLLVVENANPSNYDPGFAGFVFPDGALAAYCSANVYVGTGAPVIVASILPAYGEIESSLADVQVSGSGFVAGAEVKLVKNDDPLVVINASGENVTGGTMIACDLDLQTTAGAAIGVYDVVVTNPVGDEGQLDDGFEIKASEWPYWWENIMYCPSRLGRNPSSSSPDPASWSLWWQQSAPSGMKFMTPVVAYDKIFFTSTSSFYADTQSRVYAYNLNTGSQLWSAYVNPSGITSVRFMAGFAYYQGSDNVERLIVGGDKIYCFDANTGGTPLWTFDVTSPSDDNWLAGQLLVYNGMVLAKGRNLHHFYALDAMTGAVIIDTPVGSSFESGLSAKDGKAYMVSFTFSPPTCNLECVDLTSGELLWTTPTGHQTEHWAEPCVEDGKIYLTDYYGYVMCFAAETYGSHPPGSKIWELQVPSGNPLNGGVSKFGNRLFCGCAFTSPIYCIIDDGESGHIGWSSSVTGYFDAHTTVTTSPSYPNGVVIASSLDGYIYCLDATTGSTITSINTGNEIRAGASMVGDKLISVGGSSVRVYHKP
jgi:outer membrane protein assembly factor BamB